ncbi:TIGR04104 family putative zinc finger protein [Virgibacillus byunsanensis]|uniref:TIGR04104 family putative zinc finger protein n=1 Tax=Virgibacillus byunsanensis TaxID=570945 RepID=A0ABW3LRW3_9BACI
MKLPVCWSCDYHFKWKELLFVINGRKKCPHCRNRQYFTTHTHWKSGVLGIPLPISMIVLNSFGFPFAWTIFIMFLTLLVYFAILPFQYEFTNEIQPLF